MTRLRSGLAAGMIIKRAGPYSDKGIIAAPYVNLSGRRPGVTEANANLAQAAYDAKNNGLLNIDGLPGAAGYVRRTLTGKQVNPSYWAQKARAAAAIHSAVPQRVAALRARAQALRGMGGGREGYSPEAFSP